MRVKEGRLDVKLISPTVMKDYMKFRRMTLRSLAEAVTRAGVPTSKATIGHIITKTVKTVTPERATAIAEALDVPVNVLFAADVSTVQRDVAPKKGKVA